MAIVSYEPLPGGGWVAHHDDGTLEYLDANLQSLGTDTPGATDATLTDPVTGLIPPPPQAAPPPSLQRANFGLPNAPGAANHATAPTPAFDPSMLPSGFDLSGYGGRLSPNTPFTMTPDTPQASTPLGNVPMADVAMPSGGGYAPSGNPYGGSAQSNPYSNAPSYADGSQNPLQGGAPRTPGGKFNDGSSGYQQQLYVGGVAAGPFDTHGDPGPSTPAYGGGSSGGSGGGGGGTSPMYDAIRAKGEAMASKVRSMGGGGSSGYSSSSYSGNTPAYKRQQRQYKQDQRQQQRAYADGSYLYDQYKMRGFSKGFDPQQAIGLQSRPSALIPRATKGTGLDPTGNLYGSIAALPAAQLSMMLYGNHGKVGKPLMSTTYSSSGKAKQTPMTGLTLGGIGSTTRGPSTFTNNLAKFYEGLATTGSGLDYDTLAHHLTAAKGHSQLGAMFKNQPLGTATQNFESMMNALLTSTGLDPRTQAARAATGEQAMDEYGSQFLKKPPKKAPMINRWVGSRIFG